MKLGADLAGPNEGGGGQADVGAFIPGHGAGYPAINL